MMSRVLSGAVSLHALQLRRLDVPWSMVDAFLHLAASNTASGPRGIETCGILTGRLTPQGGFAVTHLVLPKQTAGPGASVWARLGDGKQPLHPLRRRHLA
jgi:hypothetical protein